MSTTRTEKKPYDERSDDEKLISNWTKAIALFLREDWSACIVRIATSTEISANIYIRHYLQEQHNLPESFVNSLLVSANGVDGKFKRLITPAAKCLETWDNVKANQKNIETINKHRNEIVHAGKFKNKGDAEIIFTKAQSVISSLSPTVSEKLPKPFDPMQ